jgi:hypothetical protein
MNREKEMDEIVMRAGLLLNSFLNDYEDFKAAEGPEKELRQVLLARRMDKVDRSELSITLLLAMDMLHKVGPDAVQAAMEKWITENPETA